MTSLLLRNTGLDDARLERLVSSLHDSSRLQYLNLNCNDITADGIQHVVDLIRDHPRLESLAYVENDLHGGAENRIIGLFESKMGQLYSRQ